MIYTPSGARFQDGLAFTRSIGDLHLHTYGVTHFPEIHSVDLAKIFGRQTTESPICLVLATDGVWDAWKYDDVARYAFHPPNMDILKEFDDGTQRIASDFIQKNHELAESLFGKNIDNATAILVYLSM
jgi:serine/threonine protein phosphatase PrpC